MNNNRWSNVFPEVPKSFHVAVQSTLISCVINKTERKKIVKKRFFILLAAVVAVLGITAAATYVFQWNDKLAERFDANSAQQERLVSDGAISDINQSATDNGLTVTAVQTLGDKNGIYVLFSVKSPEEACLTGSNGFEHFSVTIDGAEPGLGYSGGFIKNASASAGSNESYYELWISNYQQQQLTGKEITVSFANLQADRGKHDFYTVTEGNWSLSWPLSYLDETTVLEINKTYDIAGKELLVKSLELSPLSMTLSLGGEGLPQLIENSDLNEAGTLLLTVMNMKDGTEFPLYGPGATRWDETSFVTTGSFDKVLDLDQISSLALTFYHEDRYNTLTINLD